MFKQKWSKTKPSKGVLLNKGHYLARGLVGYWLMNEGVGRKVYSLSGNENTGTFGVGAASPSWIGGRFGPALSFNGNDTLALASTITFTGPYTIAMWFYADAWDAAYRMMISRGISGTYEKIGTNNDQLHFFIRSKINGTADTTSVDLPSTGVWHLCVLTRNSANKVDCYIDNNPAIRLHADAAQTDNAVWGAIGDSAAGQFWNGKLDNTGMWNRCLTQGEINQLYSTPFAMFDKARVWGAAAAAGNIKKIAGVSWANVKKVSGVAVASIKKIAGVAAS